MFSALSTCTEPFFEFLSQALQRDIHESVDCSQKEVRLDI